MDWLREGAGPWVPDCGLRGEGLPWQVLVCGLPQGDSEREKWCWKLRGLMAVPWPQQFGSPWCSYCPYIRAGHGAAREPSLERTQHQQLVTCPWPVLMGRG